MAKMRKNGLIDQQKQQWLSNTDILHWLPVEVKSNIESIFKIVKKYGELIDGEISYDPLTIDAYNYRIAKNFFSEKVQLIKDNEIQGSEQLITREMFLVLYRKLKKMRNRSWVYRLLLLSS